MNPSHLLYVEAQAVLSRGSDLQVGRKCRVRVCSFVSPNQVWIGVRNQVGGIEWSGSPARERSFSVGLKQSIADGRKGSITELLPEKKKNVLGLVSG